MAHAGGNVTRMGGRGRTCAVERAGDVDGAGDGVRAPQSHTARRGVREWAFDVMDAASHDEMNADIEAGDARGARRFCKETLRNRGEDGHLVRLRHCSALVRRIRRCEMQIFDIEMHADTHHRAGLRG